MSAALALLQGCAAYRDIRPGSILGISSQERLTPVGKSETDASPVVEQETVTVPFLEEPAPPADYVVGPGDVLFINVNGQPEFSSISASSIASSLHPLLGNRVDGSGNIQFPIVGSVQVGGLTLPQIQKRLQELLTKYIKEPWVIVEVTEYKSHPLYLLGAFKNSGTYYMDRPLNVLQGIALANGYDPSANLSGARIIRDKKVIPVDVYDLLTRGDQRQNIWLKPGDTIFIPDTKNQQVFVFGAVKKGGPVPMTSKGLTLAEAIATAEIRDTGYDINHIRIIRSISATRGELIVVDFERILRGKALPFMLKEGDIVFVPKSGLGDWNDAINELLPSLQTVSAILQPFVSIKYLRQ